jgi:hypothetical protein
VTHAPGCTMPEPTTDPSGHLRCPSCHYVQPRPRGSSAATGYVCRDHHDQPVTWRGTGCTRCAADIKRRKASKLSDYTESEY